MIEVVAKLPQGHVFLSGEIVECSITFIHPQLPSHMVSQSNTDALESLAWASAQIHCQCFSDSKISKLQDLGSSHMFTDTSLNASLNGTGKIEISTKPKILFCDLRLAPGQSKTCMYTPLF